MKDFEQLADLSRRVLREEAYGSLFDGGAEPFEFRLEALAYRFLRVDREEIEPTNVSERAWLRLKGRREFEKEQEAAPPPEPPQDYGIIEWDKEKCWW